MGLLDSIEKLITEHGSAAILRERIALANDKHAALEKKASALESENSSLKVQLQDAKSEAESLRNELAKASEQSLKQKTGSSPTQLEEVREKILVLLSKQDGLGDEQVGQALSISPKVASFHLQELQSASMVRCTLRVGQRFTPWHLSHEGTRYLVTRGLVA